MEYIYHYTNLADREEKVAEAEALGYRMLHDDFDPEWKAGQEPFGTLIFTDEPEPSGPPPHRDLAKEIDELKAKVKALTDIAKVNGVA